MKILGISGSPRICGNTDILLEEVLKGAASAGAETDKLILDKMNIAPCSEEEYEKVNEDGSSIVDDDIKVVFEKIKGSDVLVVASPIFFGSLSAQMKTMIDRFQSVWAAKNMFNKDVFPEKKKGAFLSVSSASRQDFFDNAKAIVKHFFATINVEYKEELFCPGLEEKGKIKEHKDMLKKAFDIGKNLAA